MNHSGQNPNASPELNRRRFLEATGFTISLATLGGCQRAPVETALPLPERPEGQLPGRLQYYASACAGCSAACGMLVGTRDGRPLKMEGLPEHPLSRGGLCAIGQAQVLGLYDSQRLALPVRSGKKATWEEVDAEIIGRLEQLRSDNRAVRVVTPTVTSPTLQASIDAFLARFSGGQHVVFDAMSHSAILDAHQNTHGARLLPHYKFERAAVVVSFGADFLGTWISPVEFTAGWRSRRVPTTEEPQMSWHAQFESRLSLTGSKADERVRIHPDEQGSRVARLAEKVAALANQPQQAALTSSNGEILPDQDALLTRVADRLWAARGESLVVCDSQDVNVQVIVNYLNHLLGNYGRTLDLERPSGQCQSNDRQLANLLAELDAGQVGALLVAGTDLTHNLPDRERLATRLSQVPLVISCAEREDDFSSLAHFVCPDHHPLEAWGDAEPVSGTLSLSQPALEPIGQTRSLLESLTTWSGPPASGQPAAGSPATARELVQTYWRERIYARKLPDDERTFTQFWEQTLHDGYVAVEPQRVTPQAFQTTAVKTVEPVGTPAEFSLVLYHKVAMRDSRHAHNPWLQELPDPITKVTWGNYVSVSEATAGELDLTDGDMVQLSAGAGQPPLELPVLIQPGQHDRTLAVALGYGCRGTDRFATIGPQWLEARPTVEKDQLVGQNAAPLIELRDGKLRYSRDGVTISKVGRRRELASTQEHGSILVPPEIAPHGAERRAAIQETALAAFARDPHSGAAEQHFDSETQLWPEDHPATGHAWGMVIDLNTCTGCSACVIACQAENNVPVVGYDEVRRQREMHWLRIDRYYEGEGDDVDVAHQPMMCQHCDNAPCETVCPVLATVHSSEGLNEQVYNRCVGTRYCANNCPYKVRRFNWFQYARDDTLQNLALNPEVTVRGRGVMEKCSLCVQRIEQGKIDARSQGAPLADGVVQTACQQSCPAQAIVFGDMNDPNSVVHAAQANPRRYRVLEELNVRPSVSYLRAVHNREGGSQDG